MNDGLACHKFHGPLFLDFEVFTSYRKILLTMLESSFCLIFSPIDEDNRNGFITFLKGISIK